MDWLLSQVITVPKETKVGEASPVHDKEVDESKILCYSVMGLASNPSKYISNVIIFTISFMK